MERVYTLDPVLGGRLLAAGEVRVTKTVSLRLKPHQAEQVEAAALAANLPVATYLYRRVTDMPILSTPALAALAQLISLVRNFEVQGRCEPHVLDELRALVRVLSGTAGQMEGAE